MALACEPTMLIADEPTTALDTTVQAQIMDLLHSLIEDEGMSMMFISHDLGLVAQHCNRAYVMSRARSSNPDPSTTYCVNRSIRTRTHWSTVWKA